MGYSDIRILSVEHAKAGCIVGSVAGGYTMRTLGMSVAGYVQDLLQRLCGIAWHCEGAHFGLHVLRNNKMSVF